MSDPSRPRWPFGSGRQIAHAVVIAFLLVTHFIVGFVLVGPALGLDEDVFDGSGAALVMTAAQGVWALGLVIGVGLLWLGRVTPRDLGWRADHLARDVGLGALGSLLLLAIVMGPAIAMGETSVGELTTTIAGFTFGQRVQILCIGLLAALTEETVFRGYLQRGLVTKLGLPAGIVLTAVIFAAYHIPMGQPPLHLVLKAGSGLVLGALRGRDRSLVAPAIAHFLFWQLVGFA